MLFPENSIKDHNGSLKLQNYRKNIPTLCRWQPHTFSREVLRRWVFRILNKQDPAINYTVEFEDNIHSLNFLDVSIVNNTTNKKMLIQSTSKGRSHIQNLKELKENSVGT